MTRKLCVRCREERPIDAFHGDRSRSDGRYPYCRVCAAEVSAASRVKNASPEQREKDRRRAQQRMWGKTGISFTLDEYDQMFLKQGGVCAICSQSERAKNTDGPGPLRVDHDHGTGRVRGLLCHSCNVALGLMQEDVDRLEMAARYLRRHND
jgi:hypothetical protein